MKIAIFDPAQHVVGLKLLFEEADYYSISPNSFFKYQQRTNKDFHDVYKFNFKEDIVNLNDTNYDFLIVVFVTYDGCFKKPEDACGADIMLEHIRSIIKNNKFKNILYFDNYDYNYSPEPLLKIDNKNIIFFKRNYCYDVEYSNNTYSFPFMIFGQPLCILWTLLTENSYKSFNKEFFGIFFSGAVYKHVDDIVGIVDRETIYNEIKGYLHTYSSLDNKTYLEIMGKYIMALDLNGVGNPNRRTFEILLTNTLLISQKNKLVWPFEEQFDENTIFENKDDFISKMNKFNTDVNIYLTAKQKQDYIFNRYFNKEWLRNYILSKISLE